MRKKAMIFGLVLFLLPSFRPGLAKPSQEIMFGYYTDGALVSTQTILFNSALNQKISEIGNRVAKNSDRTDLQYTYRILVDPMINAYSASGGFIYVNTGLLDILETEDELAAILAHEIAHTNKKHQINFVHTQNAKEIGKYALGAVFAGVIAGLTGGALGPETTQLFQNQIVDLSVNLGMYASESVGVAMVIGYGKSQELEADALAVQYLQKAGYDPNALIRVFKKLIAIRDKLGISPKNYISSLVNAEPGLEERIKKAEKLKANPIPKK